MKSTKIRSVDIRRGQSTGIKKECLESQLSIKIEGRKGMIVVSGLTCQPTTAFHVQEFIGCTVYVALPSLSHSKSRTCSAGHILTL